MAKRKIEEQRRARSVEARFTEEHDGESVGKDQSDRGAIPSDSGSAIHDSAALDSTPSDASANDHLMSSNDPIIDEVQAFLQRRVELVAKLQEEIEATQRRLEELQETLALIQGEMSLAAERDKKAKKPKPKPNRTPSRDSQTDEGETKKSPRALTTDDSPQDERISGEPRDDAASSDETEAPAQSPLSAGSLPNEPAVD